MGGTDLFERDGFFVVFLEFVFISWVFLELDPFLFKKNNMLYRSVWHFFHQKKVRKDEASSLRRKLRVSTKMCWSFSLVAAVMLQIPSSKLT